MTENDTKRNISLSPSLLIKLCIIYGLLAYFVYGNIDAVLGVILIAIVTSIVFWLSVIPIVGWITAIIISYFWLIPAMLSLVGLEWTWLITLIFVVTAFLGFLLTIIVCIAILMVVFK